MQSHPKYTVHSKHTTGYHPVSPQSAQQLNKGLPHITTHIQIPNEHEMLSPSSEANSSSGGHTVLYILWKPKLHYSIQKYLQLIPVLIQMQPVYIQPIPL